MKKLGLLIVMALAIVMPISVNAATTLTEELATVQEGGTLTIDGEYTENLVVDKSVTIEGTNDAVLNGTITVSGDNITVNVKNLTINGMLNITASTSSVTVDNVLLDGNNEVAKNILMTIRAKDTEIIINNSEFKGFLKAGIYAETLNSLSVVGSKFNALGTANIGDISDFVASNPEHEAILRSAACIDLNLGNQSGVTFDLDSIVLLANEFKGVVKTAEDSTAGAVKIKLKNANNVTLSEDSIVTVMANTFEENTDDVVIGTSGDATTSNFPVAFYQNESTYTGATEEGIRITNRSDATNPTEIINSKNMVIRNYNDTSDPEQNGEVVIVNIDGTDYALEQGTTLKDAVLFEDFTTPIDLDSLKEKEGYTFKNFVIKGTDTVVTEDQEINESMELTAVFEENVSNPSTSDNVVLYFGLLIAGLVGITAILVAKRRYN